MKDLEHARLLLEMAGKDLTAVKAMIGNDDFSDEIFGFHAQQTVEKALKAWLSSIGVKYPRIHDLEELFEVLRSQGISVPEKFIPLQNLTDFAVILRYEMIEKFSEPLDRAQIVNQVVALHRHISDQFQG